MDSEVIDFCTKYAPRSLGELLGVGNQRLVSKIIAYRGQKRVLAAEFGTGKTAATHQVAAGLNCRAPLPLRPCGICAQCVFTYKALGESPSVMACPPDGEKFWILDTSRAGVEVVRGLTDALTVFAGPPGLVVFDEFQNAGEDVQQQLLKLFEIKLNSTILVCLARVDAQHLTKALLQRLSPPLVPTKPTVAEFAPLIQRVLTAESIPLVDPGAPELLTNVCGRVPRLVLKALEEIKIEESGLSLRVVEAIASRLRIAGEGKEREK